MEEMNWRILLVEDEAIHAKLAIHELNKVYPSVTTKHVEDGGECFESLKQDNAYDLILLDYSLPKMNGIEVMKKILEMGFSIPIIIVTGHGNEKIAVEAMKLGACDYLIKSEDYFGHIPYVIRDCLEMVGLRKEKSKLQAKLKESEECFRNLFMASTDGIIILDNQYRITSFNPATLEILGYNKEFLEQGFFSALLANPQDLDDITKSLEAEEKVTNKELILLAENGEKKIALLSFFDIRNDQNQLIGLGCVFKDITERKKAENRIKALLEETQQKSEELAQLNKTLEDYITGKRFPV